MGNKWTVKKWVQFGDDYRYEDVYRGESAIVAFWRFYKAKRAGSGCVKIEWRGA